MRTIWWGLVIVALGAVSGEAHAQAGPPAAPGPVAAPEPIAAPGPVTQPAPTPGAPAAAPTPAPTPEPTGAALPEPAPTTAPVITPAPLAPAPLAPAPVPVVPAPAPTVPADPAPVITTEAPAPSAAPAPATRAPQLAVSEANTESEPEPLEQRAPQLYLRLGFGVGFPFGSDVADTYDPDDAELDFSGFGTAMDWMGGAAVLPQLFIGLGATTDTLASGTISGKGISDRKLDNSLFFAVLGAFADYYPLPPAGFHLQLLFGLSHLSRADDLGQHTGNGFGTVLGAGYDFVVGRRFNLGVLARVAVSSFGMDAVNGQQPEPTLYEPTLLWTATFRPE